MPRYVTFLLDLVGHGAAKRVFHAPKPSLAPSTAFEWRVTCDAEGKVVVHALDRGGVVLIATGRWRDGELEVVRERSDMPNEHQWALIRDALGAEQAAAAAAGRLIDPTALIARADYEAAFTEARPNRRTLRRTQPSPTPTSGAAARPRLGLVLLGVFAIAAVITVAVVLTRPKPRAPSSRPPDQVKRVRPPATAIQRPAPEPPIDQRILGADGFVEAIAMARPLLRDGELGLDGGAGLLARYASVGLRWADVEVPPETTIGHVLKDAEVERGKRMCVEGELDRIERHDLGPRKVYLGGLHTADADEVAFIAVGTTGELVRRSRGRFCGAVIGRAGDAISMVGMFDLAENRGPIVEQ